MNIQYCHGILNVVPVLYSRTLFIHSVSYTGCPFLLQGIFPTQRSNPGLPHCRQVLSCWASRDAQVLRPASATPSPPCCCSACTSALAGETPSSLWRGRTDGFFQQSSPSHFLGQFCKLSWHLNYLHVEWSWTVLHMAASKACCFAGRLHWCLASLYQVSLPALPVDRLSHECLSSGQGDEGDHLRDQGVRAHPVRKAGEPWESSSLWTSFI